MPELTSKDGDWIVIRENNAHCNHCGESKPIPFPMPLQDLPAWLRKFRDKHIRCTAGGAE